MILRKEPYQIVSDDQLIRSYLLGAIAGDDRAAVEDRLFSDSGFFGLVEAMEAEIMDEYASGKLKSSERRGWELYLTAHPESEARLRLSRNLVKRFRSSKTDEGRAFRRWRWWIPVGVAVAALLVVLVVIPRRDSERQTEPPVVIAAMIRPGTLRSGAPGVQIVAVPPNATILRLELGDRKAISGRLRFVDTNQIVWTGTVSEGRAEISVQPALKSGDYVLTTLDGSGEELGDYSFRILRAQSRQDAK